MRGLIAKSLGSQAAQAEVIVEGQRSVQARIRRIADEDLANITGAAARALEDNSIEGQTGAQGWIETEVHLRAAGFGGAEKHLSQQTCSRMLLNEYGQVEPELKLGFKGLRLPLREVRGALKDAAERIVVAGDRN